MISGWAGHSMEETEEEVKNKGRERKEDAWEDFWARKYRTNFFKIKTKEGFFYTKGKIGR